MIFDNVDEFYKIVKLFFGVELFFCIMMDDIFSLCCLSMKFGVVMDIIESFLSIVKEFGFNVVGVSFYVGFGVFDFMVFC